jgi:hypothetical protein
VDPKDGQAKFEGRSFAIAEKPVITAPEVGGPSEFGTVGPFAMVGLQEIDDPITAPAATENAFEITLTGASAVTLDLDRMGIDTSEFYSAHVETEHPLKLTLKSANGTETRTMRAGSTDLLVTAPS